MGNKGRPRRAVAALTSYLLLAGAIAGAAPAQAAPAHLAGGTPAATPPMGFNNWNAFGCDVNEALIKETADIFVSSGLKDAGYQYVNIDDCWSARERGADGKLVPDPVKFPNGIKGVADYVHAKGLKLGIYGDAGTKTCAGYPGSLGHEDVDAQTWADWGVDYLKYDNCNNQSDGSQADYVRRYTAMRAAIGRTGRSIVYSICEWGTSQPWLWAKGIGDLWRTTGDISDNWSSIRSIIRQNAPLAPYAGPGHWNDPDMLEVGNGGMTATEYRSHMGMWAMMAAPLIIGTDLRKASAETLSILGNREVIAIDQDRLGVQASVVSDSGGLMVLDKPLAGGDRAIALHNSTDSLATISVAARDTGLARAGAYRLHDVWTGDTLQARSTISAGVPAHGTVVYRVRPLRDPAATAPAVAVGAGLGTIVPGPAGGGSLTTTVTNRGAGALRDLAVSANVPAGWSATPTTAQRRERLATDATLETAWTIGVPANTPAGRYPITVTAAYRWGPRNRAAATSSEIVAIVVNAPADGRRHLSTLPAVTSVNATGPVELDQGNGGPLENDGSLITVGGVVYTRGLGTSAASEITYYLGGRCSKLVTDAGIDDTAGAGATATFSIYAGDTLAATSGSVGTGQAPTTLTADLTGATWLRLVATPGGSSAVPADWAKPVLTCGGVADDSPVLPQSQTLFSFESGTDGFTIANPGDGGTVAQSPLFHTDGVAGLKVATPAGGNWFGRALSAPLDLTGKTMLRYDVKTGGIGTSGEIAIQVGDDMSWCQGGLWTWTGTDSSRTITERFDQIGCPAGVTLDPSAIRAVWVFLNSGGEVYIDNVRAE
ncbi:NPCBM/NEW2 domain-containing protein [Nonomuraea zeae]|uniref:Alpha-galactosidase n=1 Tax=Nonomuraea zeae TaxID=1642303 RepID=A0A5S4GIN7_9ACTN|nr:NPCBM/NEW2 domain-containing protein [Nonomuraea zeae]TMR26110.1 alpha-galactosidase [Nonomuraea zeae]